MDDERTVEWHTIRPVPLIPLVAFRVSFDIRLGASRFIVIRRPGELIWQGLIHDAIKGPRCLCDEPEPPMPTAVEEQIVLRWEEMQTRLKLAARES